ncbi:MAG: F0F1 ATP synthase subunit epsilon [Desulfosarcina sp.]|nr:F0F1 ATP synthase subunit epsilon [Desulfosarcina sp.]MBC2741768.1 F0F1 ATP synthase subunit epsilon [Desulfosarcina sp.]MBC2764682.1 F0F1 ATP synthase subunit epsilon [Desulfosarcina sp.]
MAENIRLEVVTPEKSVVSEGTQIVMAPGSLGEFGVLSGHTPFLTTLKTGALKYKDESGRERFVFVSSGFAEALPDRVTVLAESAERRKDIDVQRAKSAAERAEVRLQSGDRDIDFLRAKVALLRAISRIQLAGTR